MVIERKGIKKKWRNNNKNWIFCCMSVEWNVVNVRVNSIYLIWFYLVASLCHTKVYTLFTLDCREHILIALVFLVGTMYISSHIVVVAGMRVKWNVSLVTIYFAKTIFHSDRRCISSLFNMYTTTIATNMENVDTDNNINQLFHTPT